MGDPNGNGVCRVAATKCAARLDSDRTEGVAHLASYGIGHNPAVAEAGRKEPGLVHAVV